LPRERDLSFEKLAEVCGIDITALTPTTRGAMNAALKDIRLASPGLDDADLAVILDGKAATYVKVMDGALLTPTALSKHWAALDGMLAAQKRAAPVTNAEAPRIQCDTCDGLRFVLAYYRNPGVRTPDQYDAERHGHEVMSPCPDCNMVGMEIVRKYLNDFNLRNSGGPRLKVPEQAAHLFGRMTEPNTEE
jgi:hypothetical protein